MGEYLIAVPKSHVDLLQGTVDVILTTLSLKGYPQSTLVWCSFDGSSILLNTGIGYQKEKNMRKNPHVSVFAVDPKDKLRWVEVQGDAQLIEEGAVEHLNQLSYLYTGKRDFYKEVMPELAGIEKRVIVKITPISVKIGRGIPILPKT